MKLVVEEKSNKKYLISLNNKSKSLNIVLINNYVCKYFYRLRGWKKRKRTKGRVINLYVVSNFK